MGHNQTKLADQYAQEFEEIKLSSEEAINQAKRNKKKNLLIAEKLNMTGFEIKVEKGPWNLEIILGYVRKLQEMKCSFDLNCDKEVYAINKEDSSSICKNHYSSSISGQIELREKYERINDIVRDVENTFMEFQDTFINAKATIAILKSNMASLINYKDLLEEIERTERHLDFQVDKTVGYPSETLKANMYNIYQAMKREMDLTIPDIEKIHNL